MYSSHNEVDLETLLVKFDILGRYHLKLILLLGFVSITNSWYSSNYVFITEDTRYRCKYQECEETSFSKTQFNMTDEETKCYKYTLLDAKAPCSDENVNKTNFAICDEWVFEDPNSFIAEFQMACEDWKRTLIGTVHSIGYMLGLLIVGPLSDKFGRKKIIIFCGVTGGIIGLGRSIIRSYWGYVVLEFTEAFIGDPYSPAFTLGIEMVAKDKRVLIMSILSAILALGGVLKAYIAWTVSHWRHYLQMIYAPAFFFVFYIFFMDESIRWLLSKGRKEEAVEIIRKAAQTNNIDIDKDTLSNIKWEQDNPTADLIGLLKITITSKTLLLRVIACTCMWVTTTFNAYALLINSVSLEGNKYLHYGIMSSCGIPSSFVLVFLLCRYKRKMPLILSLGLTGAIFIVQSLIPKEYPWTAALLFYAGKCTSGISFAAVYLYTSELFPTYTRNTMHALCSSVGRIGSTLAPQTPLLAKYWSGIPSVLVGSLSLATTFVIMLMPDTAEDALPDTVQQAEAVGCKEPQKHNEVVCSRL